MKAASKVVLNTGILYGRMLITVGLSLYATRLVLNALGTVDYGIFNLVAGVITMLAFLNNAMATSTQRFLSFYQGKKDTEMQKKVFINSLILHIIIGLVVLALLELVGLFLFHDFLNIPVERIDTAKTVYRLMSVSVFFTITAVPFVGSLVAHENMLWVATVSIIEVLNKLGLAILLTNLDGDRLVFYAWSMVAVNVINLLLYAAYCITKYDECSFGNILKPDLAVCKELASFTGWSLFGAICGLGRTQGLAIILNLFFGAVVNAAYGIANQVAGQLNFFSSSLLRALNPQIMKSEGAGDRKRMLRLSMMASKFGFFLLAILGIPCIFEMKSILSVWLTNVPENTVIFCQLIILGTLTNQLTIGLQSAIQATGKIKYYQIFVGSIILFNLPVSYLLLKLGYPPYSVLIAFCIIELIACSARILFLRALAGLSIYEYSMKVFFRELGPVAMAVATCMIITDLQDDKYRFVATVVANGVVFAISIYLLGLEVEERSLIKDFLSKTLRRFNKTTTHQSL